MSRPLYTGSLFIVSEGEKTEASFYADFQQKLKEAGCAHFSQVDFYKIPKPKDLTDNLPDTELRTEGGRQLRGALPALPADNYQPLNWIKIACSRLGAYDEAWTLFDNDHRNDTAKHFIDKAVSEYHQLIATPYAHLRLNIAYSSLSFEYYLLLHFQYLYHTFTKTECYWIVKQNHDYRNCCSRDPKDPPKEGACDGILDHGCCINGYARLHDYWSKSKTDGVLSRIHNIYTGIINTARIRWQAIQSQRGTSLGCMNPYLNTYQLTLRMMGLQLLEYDRPVTITSKYGDIVLQLEGDTIHVMNRTTTTLLLTDRYMPVFTADNADCLGKTPVGNLSRCLVPSQHDGRIDISSLSGTDRFAIFDINGQKVMVLHLPFTDDALSEAEAEMLRLVNN